jgi:HEAT repeat protein
MPNQARESALLSFARGGTPSVRLEAAEKLCDLAFAARSDERKEFVPDVATLLTDGLDDIRCVGLALAAVVLPKPEAVDVLTRHLTDTNNRVRVEATGRLADLAWPGARGALAATLNDPHLNVRFEAARGMVALEHPAGFEVLVEALSHPDFRFRAAGALAQLGKKEAIEPLRRVFNQWLIGAFDKTQMAGALALLGDEKGVAHLFERTTRKRALDRCMAIEMLGETKAPGAKARLLAIVADSKDAGRGAAARALGRLGDVSVEPVLTALANEVTEGDDFRLDVAEGLLLLGSITAREVVQALRLTEADARDELAALLRESEGP